MSWDVSIMRFGTVYASIEEIDDDEQGLLLGSPAQVHDVVRKHFPGTDWSDAAWGMFDCPFGSVEFNRGEDDPATGMMLHVRASDEIVVC
jgi:hypothetical protein